MFVRNAMKMTTPCLVLSVLLALRLKLEPIAAHWSLWGFLVHQCHVRHRMHHNRFWHQGAHEGFEHRLWAQLQSVKSPSGTWVFSPSLGCTTGLTCDDIKVLNYMDYAKIKTRWTTKARAKRPEVLDVCKPYNPALFIVCQEDKVYAVL